MINKFCIMLVLTALVLVVPFDAKPEKIMMGAYNVSFDMGNVGPYTISIKPPLEGKNLAGSPYRYYEANIKGGAYLAEIGILDFKEFIGNNLEEAVKDQVESPLCKPDAITRIIDNKTGAISQSCDNSLFAFGYPLITSTNLSASEMLATVMVVSGYPWEKGTSDLADTIHVEVPISKNAEIRAAEEKSMQEWKEAFEEWKAKQPSN